MTGPAEPLRLTDILTNAASLADLERSEFVTAGHVLQAVRLLRGDDTATPGPSPVLGHGGRRAIVVPEIRELAQRWFARLGRDPLATLDAQHLEAFLEEVRAVEADRANG